MKTIMFLGLTTLMLSSAAFSQSYYEEDYPAYEEPMFADEGSFDSELQPPLADEDYYYSSDIEQQEEYPYLESADTDWTLEGEEIPVDEYDSGY